MEVIQYYNVTHYPISNSLQLFLNENSVPYSKTPDGPTSVVGTSSSIGEQISQTFMKLLNIKNLLKQPNKAVIVPTKAVPKKPAKGALIIDSKDGKLKLYNGKDGERIVI